MARVDSNHANVFDFFAYSLHHMGWNEDVINKTVLLARCASQPALKLLDVRLRQ